MPASSKCGAYGYGGTYGGGYGGYIPGSYSAYGGTYYDVIDLTGSSPSTAFPTGLPAASGTQLVQTSWALSWTACWAPVLPGTAPSFAVIHVEVQPSTCLATCLQPVCGRLAKHACISCPKSLADFCACAHTQHGLQLHLLPQAACSHLPLPCAMCLHAFPSRFCPHAVKVELRSLPVGLQVHA